jgi:hypothetical protein
VLGLALRQGDTQRRGTIVRSGTVIRAVVCRSRQTLSEIMKLPAAERAVIEPAKIRDYLLSTAHPVGRFKSVFFASLGYTSANWRRLDEDLRTLAVSGDAET